MKLHTTQSWTQEQNNGAAIRNHKYELPMCRAFTEYSSKDNSDDVKLCCESTHVHLLYNRVGHFSYDNYIDKHTQEHSKRRCILFVEVLYSLSQQVCCGLV